MSVLDGPAGYVPVLIALGWLITRALVRERHPVAAPRAISPGSVVTCAAVLAALAILALRFTSL